MRSPSRQTTTAGSVLAAGLLLLVAGTPPAAAAETNVSDVVLVDRGVVITDDLYAVGLRAVVQGRIEGDLVVMVSEDVRIEGVVTGDVIAFAGEVTVAGEVEGSVRVVAGSVSVSGTIGGDLVLLARALGVSGAVGSDLLAVAVRNDLGGMIAGDVKSWTRRTNLSGRIGGDADLRVGRLTVQEGAAVGRDLGYRSTRPADGIELADVGGIVVQRRPLAPNIRLRAVMLLVKLVTALLAGVVGLLAIWAAPGYARRAAAAAAARPGRAWLMGFGVVLSPLVVVALGAAMVAIAPTDAALAALLGLAPFFVAVSGAVFALGFVSATVAFPWLGTFGGRHQRGIVRAFLYGLGVVLVAALLPWVGWLAALILIPLGIGGLVRPALG